MKTSATSFGVLGTIGGAFIPQMTEGGCGVVGSSNIGLGVGGVVTGIGNPTNIAANGVEGAYANKVGEGAGVHGWTNSPTGAGVFGKNWAGGDAARFIGNVSVNGTVVASGKLFRIDHPLQPSEKYLNHWSVESPAMLNVYNGNIETDGSGEAVVVLPDYFEALNRDFKYQLTVIGTFAQAVVAREIESNRFLIRTDQGI